MEHGVPGTRHPGVGRGRQAGGRRAAAIPVAAGLGAHQPNRRLRLAAEPQTGRREVSALTDARKTLAYDFFRILRAPLYELFPENEQVKNSLAGLAKAIEPGGILIYTGQPWHPQLELIAGVLTSHKDGKPWVMRVRSQAEMDSLVHDAGFDKCTQRIDEWGIFTVSMAVRRDN